MNLMRCHLTYDQRVGIALKIRAPLAEQAKKRQGARTDISPKSGEGVGKSTVQAAKQVKVGKTVVEEATGEPLGEISGSVLIWAFAFRSVTCKA